MAGSLQIQEQLKEGFMQNPQTHYTSSQKKFAPSIDKLAVHDHLCGLYETRAVQYERACNFVKTGLMRNEQCVYVAEDILPSEFISLLQNEGVYAAAAKANGSLHILTGHELRSTLGGFTPDKMLCFLAQAEQKAKADGFSALRWAAEMTWLQKDNIAAEDFFSFETKLNVLLQELDIVALCQYAKEDFKLELLVAAAETHPIFVYEETAL